MWHAFVEILTFYSHIRDLLARVHTKKARASNPKCELITKIETDPNLAAFLEIEYSKCTLAKCVSSAMVHAD